MRIVAPPRSSAAGASRSRVVSRRYRASFSPRGPSPARPNQQAHAPVASVARPHGASTALHTSVTRPLRVKLKRHHVLANCCLRSSSQVPADSDTCWTVFPAVADALPEGTPMRQGRWRAAPRGRALSTRPPPFRGDQAINAQRRGLSEFVDKCLMLAECLSLDGAQMVRRPSLCTGWHSVGATEAHAHPPLHLPAERSCSPCSSTLDRRRDAC